MNAENIIVACLVVLALGQLASAVGIWFRHAIPHAPPFFRVVPTLPIVLITAPCALVIAWMLASGTDSVLGLSIITYAAIYFAAEAFVWWSLNSYAVYHHYRCARSREGRMERMEGTLGRMEEQEGINRAQQDADRGEERTDRREGREHRGTGES